MTFGRGPDPDTIRRRLVLDERNALIDEALVLDSAAIDFAERWKANERAMLELRMRGTGTEFMSRPFRNLIRMVDDVPYFDRDVPEPIGNGMPMLEPGR